MKKPNTKEIEKKLCLDSIQPIQLTDSDTEDTEEKEQELKDWYEYEIVKLYEQINKTTKRMERQVRLNKEGRPHAYPLELTETLYEKLDPKKIKKGIE